MMWGEFTYSNGVLTGKRGGKGHSNGKGRIKIKLKKGIFYAHRIIWEMHFGKIPNGLIIDHMNGNPSDNRIENLRLVTHEGNMQNIRKPMSTNKCGLLGVSAKKHRWAATIRFQGKKKHIGYFATKEEAHVAYVEEKIKLHPTCTLRSII